ncbi:MAG TPA: crosslink repair DNA glycosylase YcaQ family protein, partial [Gaiellaceae bacterium]|nr:crosslink repair DNA glycosylase YcaQ family protein [Gaiellaceae bacterium]
GADLDPPRPTAAVLVSPFDNLLWDRAFVRRVFRFEHVIEVYKPAPERRYGYYVLPFLWRDRLAGRVDLKAERREGALVVRALHLEPGVRRSAALEEALERALDRLRRVAGLERLVREGMHSRPRGRETPPRDVAEPHRHRPPDAGARPALGAAAQRVGSARRHLDGG